MGPIVSHQGSVDPLVTPSPEFALSQLEPHAVSIATRKRQRIAISLDHEDTLFFVRTGVFFARTVLPDGRQHIFSIFYPGDCIQSAAMPPLDGTEVTTATESGEIWRLRFSVVEDRLRNDPELACYICNQVATQTARLALQNTILAGLTGDERVASLLIELALRIGRETPSGLIFDMPLSRTDIAEHLALNADTVSRIVSRMRASGLFFVAGRNRFVFRNMEALARECPIIETLRRLHCGARTRALIG